MKKPLQCREFIRYVVAARHRFLLRQDLAGLITYQLLVHDAPTDSFTPNANPMQLLAIRISHENIFAHCNLA